MFDLATSRDDQQFPTRPSQQGKAALVDQASVSIVDPMPPGIVEDPATRIDTDGSTFESKWNNLGGGQLIDDQICTVIGSLNERGAFERLFLARCGRRGVSNPDFTEHRPRHGDCPSGVGLRASGKTAKNDV